MVGAESSGATRWTRATGLVILLVVAVPRVCSGQINKIGDSVVDRNALTIKGSFGQAINGKSFQQDAVTTLENRQYVAFYDSHRRVCVGRRKLPDDTWQIIRFSDYAFESNDAHNTISMGICPGDGTIHLAWDHHVHPLHYRVSRPGVASRPDDVTWDASLFSEVTSELEKDKPVKNLTYPRFWRTPGGGLQFCYRRGRSGNGARMLVDYDPATGSWTGTRQIDSGDGPFKDAVGESRSRCSYPNGYDYGPNGTLHVTWVWRESSQGSNHDLAYAFSRDRGKTWLDNKGQAIDGPPSVTSPGIVVANIGRRYGLMNTHGQAVDSKGRVHVVMWHCTDASLKACASKPGEHRWGPPEARRYHHYWRDDAGTWHHVELPGIAGKRPKLFVDGDDDVYLITSDARGRPIDSSRGNLVIMTATAATSWTDWKVAHIERGPFVNEMLGDGARWRRDGVLSIMVQELPSKPHEPTPLRILDFCLRR